MLIGIFRPLLPIAKALGNKMIDELEKRDTQGIVSTAIARVAVLIIKGFFILAVITLIVFSIIIFTL